MAVVGRPQRLLTWRWRYAVPFNRWAELALYSVPYLLALAASLQAVYERATLGPLTLVGGRGGWHVAWVWPGSVAWDLGLRAGSMVQTLGQPGPPDVSALSTARFLLARTAGGHLLRLDPLAATSVATWLTSLLLLSLIFFLLALLVQARATDRAAARAFSILCVSTTMALVLDWPAWRGHAWALSLEFVVVALFGSAWAAFFLVFPRRAPLATPIRVALLVLPPAAVAVAYAAAVVVDVAWYGVAEALRGAVVLGGVGFGCIRLAWVLLRSQTKSDRRVLVVLTLSSVLGIAPFLLCTLIPSTLGHRPLVAPQASILPFALMPLSFAYAVARHHLFGTTVRVRRAVARLIFGLALGLAALTLVHVVAAGLPLERTALADGGLLLGALVAMATPWMWRRLDRVLFADVYDERRTLHDLTADLARLHDRMQMATLLCRRLARDVATSFVALLTYTPAAVEVLAASGPLDADLAPALTGEAWAVAAGDPGGPVCGSAGPVALWVPLRTGGALYGLLALGPKRNGEPFSRTDEHLLCTIAGTAAAALHGAELTEQLRHLSRQLMEAHEEERRALAGDLHDGPLSRLVLAAHLLATASDDGTRRTVLQQSHAAIAELRSLCHTLRSSVLDDLGLADALEELVEEARSETAAALSFAADEAARATRLDPTQEIALYRVAQQALANCLCHARATAVTVCLTVPGDARPPCLRLVVADNGRSFGVPGELLSLTAQGHFGLAGMAERMQGAGGRLNIQSEVGRGTRVVAEMPLAREGGRDEHGR